MTTPAIDVRNGQFGTVSSEVLRWWGEWQPATQTMFIVSNQEKRPQSITTGRGPDGAWGRSAWQHFWFRLGGIPDGYTVSLNNTSGNNLTGARSTTAQIVRCGPFSLAQLAPWCSDPSNTLSGEMYNLENATRTRALNRLREENVNLGTALGEISETAGFIADGAKAVYDLCSSVTKRTGAAKRDLTYWLFNGFDKTPPWHRRGMSVERRSKHAADKARDLWLQGQFSVKPLLGDIHDSAKSLDKYINGTAPADCRVTVKAGSTNERFGTAFLTHETLSGWFDFPVTLGVRSSVHASADYLVPVTWGRTFESLGLGNPAALLWELKSFSWLFDYFISAGSWVDSLSADRDCKFLGGSLSYIQRVQHVTSSTSLRLKAGAVLVSTSRPSLKVQLEAGRFERKLLAGTFLPAFMPPLKNRMNLTRMANSIFALTKTFGPNLRT